MGYNFILFYLIIWIYPFFQHPIHTMDLSMRNQTIGNQAYEKSIHGFIHGKSIHTLSTKKPLSGLLSNILIIFNFLDKFFHED